MPSGSTRAVTGPGGSEDVMTRVLYFWGGRRRPRADLIHGGEKEVLIHGDTEQVPRVGDFCISPIWKRGIRTHRYWAKVSAVQWWISGLA
jgi:hypothetical protein